MAALNTLQMCHAKFGRNRSSICELSYLQTGRRDETDTRRLRQKFPAFRLGYGLDSGGTTFRFPGRRIFFSSPKCPDLLWGPLSGLFNYRGVKLPGHEVDRSQTYGAETENAWNMSQVPTCTLMTTQGQLYPYLYELMNSTCGSE